MDTKTKQILGSMGEDAAVKYLEKHGYTIITRNWKYHPHEIDIVANYENYIVIVEVKTRTSMEFGDPYEAVTRKKQSQLVKAAQQYAELYNVEKEICFDVVEVIINRFVETKINHIHKAFIPLIGM